MGWHALLRVSTAAQVKVDLSKFVEMHQFSFDCTLDEGVTNDQVYRSTVQPLVATLFRGGKATCFAYGQVWHLAPSACHTMQALQLLGPQSAASARCLGRASRAA